MTDTVDQKQSSSGGSGLDSFFKLSERGTSVGTEIRAGFTTFLVMAYIIFVNPTIISEDLGFGRGSGGCRRHRVGRRPALHPDGGGRQLSDCDGGGPWDQRGGCFRPRRSRRD